MNAPITSVRFQSFVRESKPACDLFSCAGIIVRGHLNDACAMILSVGLLFLFWTTKWHVEDFRHADETCPLCLR